MLIWFSIVDLIVDCRFDLRGSILLCGTAIDLLHAGEPAWRMTP
jgi:hypothetical protein